MTPVTTKVMPGTGTKRVFIGGMKTTTTAQTLHDYFSQYGQVEFVDLPEEKGTQRRRGFGYVAFNDYDPVDKVTSTLLFQINLVLGMACCLP